MLKWLLTLILAVFVLGLVAPLLARHLPLGRLPGDVAFRYRERNYRFPFASTLLFSVLLTLIAWLF